MAVFAILCLSHTVPGEKFYLFPRIMERGIERGTLACIIIIIIIIVIAIAIIIILTYSTWILHYIGFSSCTSSF